MADPNIPTPKGTETENNLPPVKAEENSDSTALPPETPKVETPTEETPSAPSTETPPVVDPIETPPAPPVEQAPAKPEPDYKKKFSESTRNNQIVMSRFSELQKVLGDITRQEVPTEDEMRSLEPEWEYLSDREKREAMKTVVLERRLNHVTKAISDIALDSENLRKLQEFVENEPKLKGKEDDFIAFATKDANKGASMDVILKAYLYDVEEDTPPVPAPEPVPAPTESAPSLERGNPSAGAPQDTGRKERSPEELRELRTKNPREYNELVRKGLI